jgi:uncharacterized GH25 family protein
MRSFVEDRATQFMRKSPLLLAAALLAAFSFRAAAHEVWIEDLPDGQLVVRFAEFGDDFEKSPGNLDLISVPAAWTPGAEGKMTAFEAQKKADHFLLVGASPKNPAQAETGFAVMGKPGNPEKPARKPFFYARWYVPGTTAEPALIFDLVPTGKPGEVKVWFRGKPQAGVKVTVHPPEGDEIEVTSDAEGLIRFAADKKGFWMIAAAHQREATPGFSGGKPYDAVSHNCSLAWRQP